MDQFESSTSSEKVVCTESYPTSWYAPTPLAYNTPYMTPFPSYNFDMSVLPSTTAPWSTPQGFHDLSLHPAAPVNNLIERPHSSPSTFGPSPNEIPWPENPLGIRFPMPEPPQILGSNAVSTSIYQTPAEEFTTPSPPQRRSSADNQRFYPTLAPNPAGLAAKRRQEQEEEEHILRSNSKRRKRTPSLECLNDEERLLVTLKEEETLPWKEIAARFDRQLGQSVSVATLQMRYLRLRQRSRVWEQRDLEALRQAHEYWEKCKWEIISQKMLEFGIEERWPVKYCARKWAEIAPQQPQRGHTPQQQQQYTPRSQQHTPTPQYATLAENLAAHYGYAVSL